MTHVLDDRDYGVVHCGYIENGYFRYRPNRVYMGEAAKIMRLVLKYSRGVK